MKECTGTGTHFTHLCTQISSKFTQFYILVGAHSRSPMFLANSFARYPMCFFPGKHLGPTLQHPSHEVATSSIVVEVPAGTVRRLAMVW